MFLKGVLGGGLMASLDYCDVLLVMRVINRPLADPFVGKTNALAKFERRW
jgi:hypothetical protein